MKASRWMAVLTLIALTGCGLYESVVGIPMAVAVVQAPPTTSVDLVFQCAETSIKRLAQSDSFWRSDVTRRNNDEGILETGDFDKINVGGFRARVTLDKRTNEIRIDLKGAGAYYKDIGVEKSVADLKNEMQGCLQAHALAHWK
jgi:hypothetical protein